MEQSEPEWSADRLRVDPSAVLRACCWPVSTLDGFDHPDLAERADAVNDLRDRVDRAGERLCDLLYDAVPAAPAKTRRVLLGLRRACHRDRAPLAEMSEGEAEMVRSCGLAPDVSGVAAGRTRLARAEQRYDSAFADALAGDRAHLRRVAGGAQFRRALALANRGLADRWERIGPAPVRARDQRAERAVLRYLLRAVSRPIPSGLWAGVAPMGAPSEDTPMAGPDSGPLHIEEAEGAAAVTVDLVPFAAVIDARVRSGDVMGRLLALDATVHRTAEGWRFEHADISTRGTMIWSTLRADDLADRLVDFLWSSPARLEDFSSDEDPRVVAQFVDSLVGAGFLVSAWSPADGRDIWEILSRATEVLVGDEIEQWTSTVDRIRRICQTIEGDIATVAPHLLAERIDEVASAVGELWTWAGLDGPPPDNVVRVDLAMPWRATWSERHLIAVDTAIREHLSLARAETTAERLRSTSIAGLASGPLSEALADWSMAPPVGPDANTGAGRRSDGAREAGDRLLPTPSTLVGGEALPGPEGSVLIDLDGVGPLLSLARPQADVFTGRFAGLLDRPAPTVPDASVRTLVLDRSPNPAAARTSSVSANGRVLSYRGTPPLATMTIRFAGGRPFLVREGEVGALHYPASAGAGSPRELALLRLAMGHGWEYLSHGVPIVVEEIGTLAGTASLCLPGGGRLCRRRWALDADQVDRICGATGAERLLALRRILRERGLSSDGRVWVRSGLRADSPSLLTPTASPLVVDAVADRLDPGSAAVIERADDPQVCDPAGRGHVVSVAVRWQDPDYWSQMLPTDRLMPPPAGVEPIEWHQIDLGVEPPPGEVPRLPLAEMAELLDQLLDEGAVAQANFVRKPPGIRLRVSTTDGPRPGLDRWAEKLVESERLAGWSRGAYRPEIRRFGGPVGMALAHDHFTADTLAILRFEQLASSDRAHWRTRVSLLATQELAAACLDGETEVARLWAVLLATVPVAGADDRMRRAALAAAEATTAPLSGAQADLPPEVRRAAAPLFDQLPKTAAGVRVAAAGGWLDVGVLAWLAATTTFHWNRFGLPLDLGSLRAHVEAMSLCASDNPTPGVARNTSTRGT